MACSPFSTKPLSSPMLITVNLTSMRKNRWNWRRNTAILTQENAFENAACKMTAILSRVQSVIYTPASFPVLWYNQHNFMYDELCNWIAANPLITCIARHEQHVLNIADMSRAMTADALSPSVARSSASMALTMQDKYFFFVHEGRFERLSPSYFWEMIENYKT